MMMSREYIMILVSNQRSVFWHFAADSIEKKKKEEMREMLSGGRATVCPDSEESANTV